MLNKLLENKEMTEDRRLELSRDLLLLNKESLLELMKDITTFILDQNNDFNLKNLLLFHMDIINTKGEAEAPMTLEQNTDIEIYCDGACLGNPGPSGSGVVIYNGETKVYLAGGFNSNGTNNTAELKALLKALQIAAEAGNTIIHSDSQYSINSITKWAISWKNNNWTKKSGEIQNLEIIREAHELYIGIKDKVEIKYVKGHSGVEGNEIADRLAGVAVKQEYVTFTQVSENDFTL